MKIKWGHFDNWSAKAAAWLIVAGGLSWMVFEIRWHYHTKATSWDWFPFVASGLAIVFGLAVLSQKATAGAAAVLEPLLDRIPILRKPATTTSSVLVPPQPAQPAKVITTTVTPLPAPGGPVPPVSTDVAGTEFDEEEGK